MDDALRISSLPDDPQLLKAILIERAGRLLFHDSRLAQLQEQNQQIELENQQIELEIQRIESLSERRIAELERTNAELELEQLRLKQQLMVALKKLYGPRGDRLADEGDVAQMLLEFAAALEARPVDAVDLPTEAGQVEPQTVRRVKRRRGRRDLFLSDGQVAIHNNLAEQEMKRIALNRKNSLFVGNERGGETAAILSSFTSTCRRHGVDPQIYFTQLLANLPNTPVSQLDRWLPYQWKPATLGM